MSIQDNGGFGSGLPPIPDASGGFASLSEGVDDTELTPQGGKRRNKKRKKAKAEGAGEPRVLSNPRKLAIMFAVLAVLGIVGLLLLGGTPKTYVAQMAVPVNALSPVTLDQVKVVEMPTDAIEPGAITGTSTDQVLTSVSQVITNATTQYPVYASQQIHPEMFSTTNAALARPLGPDERLMSLRANVASSVAGGIKAGDRVDIVATDNNSGGLAGVVAKNVEIVKVAATESSLDNAAESTDATNGSDAGTNDQAKQPARPLGGTYVIRIPAADAPAIAAIDSAATRVYLVYRSPDAKDAEQLATTLRETICRNGGC